MRSASSPRGLSSVTMTRSASRSAASPISERLPGSRSPPHPNTHQHAAARVRAHRRERLGERVGRVRVVDDRERAVRQPVAFHAARRCAAGGERRERSVHVELPRRKHAERDREVLGVERADQRRTEAPLAEVPADIELETAVRGPDPADVHETRGRGHFAADCDRDQLDAGGQRGCKSRANRVADVDDGVFQAGQPEQARLCLGITLHRPVIVEVVPRQVAERGDAQAHGVDAALVECVRGHFHRDVARAGVRERAQLPVQRDDVRRGQRPARHLRRKSRAERAEVGAALREAPGRRGEQPRAGRLAVGAGDAGDREPRRRHAVEPVCDAAEAVAQRGHRDERDFRIRRAGFASFRGIPEYRRARRARRLRRRARARARGRPAARRRRHPCRPHANRASGPRSPACGAGAIPGEQLVEAHAAGHGASPAWPTGVTRARSSGATDIRRNAPEVNRREHRRGDVAAVIEVTRAARRP